MSGYNLPPDKWSKQRIAKVNSLFDLLVANPDWVSRDEIAAHLEMGRYNVDRVVRDLRVTLGATDTITVIARPGGEGGYRLVGSYQEIQPWSAGRISDAETRIESIQFSMQSIVRATDGRTSEGKKSRLIEMNMRHLLEQLRSLD